MGGEKPERIWVECHGIDGMLYQDGDGEVYLTMHERPSVPVIEYVRDDLHRKAIAALEAKVAAANALIRAGNVLCLCAQTTGGTAGRDDALVGAVERYDAALAAYRGAGK